MSDYEQARLQALRQLNLLDTPPSESFDRITRMAGQLFDLPIAAVSLTDKDRQWFKSRIGVDHWEIPRFKACCGEVADSSGVLVVNDLLESEHYRDSDLAQSGIRFYAGAPLLTREGYTLGAMCVLGTEPRTVTEQEIAALSDLAAMVMAQIELQHAVGRLDPFTQLPNYSQFADDVEDAARDQPGSQRYALSIELLDMQQAVSLQRVLGPSYLNELSKVAAVRLRELLPGSIQLYHVGPCQFACLLNSTDQSAAFSQAVYLREELSDLELKDALPFMLRPAVGIAPFHLGATKPADVLRTAHSACRDARQAEQGVGLYSIDLDARHQRNYALLTEFRQALADPEQLHLVYQPRVCMANGRCVGAEALIRWQHPDLGNVSPAEFVPLVEQTPMSRALTEWVVTRAIQQSAIWHKAGLNLRISVNIAAANLEEEDFTQRLLDRLTREQLPLNAIELELTESGLIKNGQAARQQLNALVEAGVRIAIDDFGTGYSSLAYLQKIPAHVVKIDRLFTSGLELSEQNRKLVSSMIAMAHNLGYHVVAEGVETQQTYDMLKQLQCEEAQGYLLAKPLQVDAFEAWLQAPTRR